MARKQPSFLDQGVEQWSNRGQPKQWGTAPMPSPLQKHHWTWGTEIMLIFQRLSAGAVTTNITTT